jgi:hypothetical protein
MNGGREGAEARAARDAGIKQAVDHANAVEPKWSDQAYAVLLDFLTKPDAYVCSFTSEDVRAHADKLRLPEPPHLRAWGGVFQRASRAGIIAKTGTTTARSANVHCAIIATWRAT